MSTFQLNNFCVIQDFLFLQTIQKFPEVGVVTTNYGLEGTIVGSWKITLRFIINIPHCY
jgi:hypothetical protein